MVWKDVQQLIYGRVCDVHEKFFQRIIELRFTSVALLDAIIFKQDDVLTMEKPSQGEIKLSDSSYRLGCSLMIASIDGRPPSGGSDARSFDRDWIDTDLIRHWKESCESNHGAQCLRTKHSWLTRPPCLLLIDIMDNCLVNDTGDMPYVALSYVWGGSDVMKTTMAVLDELRKPGSLQQPDIFLPQTIKHAMSVVRLLGERYLWVDALCIVQDDDETRHALINNMSAVYANASLAIIAADGSNANEGIRGLRGISFPRYNPCLIELPGGISLNWPSSGGLGLSPWNERGWTFQEYFFSRRRLIFVSDSVRWECARGCLWEEHQLPGHLPTTETKSVHDTTTLVFARPLPRPLRRSLI